MPYFLLQHKLDTEQGRRCVLWKHSCMSSFLTILLFSIHIWKPFIILPARTNRGLLSHHLMLFITRLCLALHFIMRTCARSFLCFQLISIAHYDTSLQSLWHLIIGYYYYLILLIDSILKLWNLTIYLRDLKTISGGLLLRKWKVDGSPNPPISEEELDNHHP